MTEFERFAAALAKTESDDRELAFGDAKHPSATSMVHTAAGSFGVNGANFMAMGRWQMHPAFVWDFRPEPIHVDSSWDEIFHQVLHNFYQRRRSQVPSIDSLAMEFHLGVTAVAHGDWDAAYADRFSLFLAAEP